jgi:hypothetical protein
VTDWEEKDTARTKEMVERLLALVQTFCAEDHHAGVPFNDHVCHIISALTHVVARILQAADRLEVFTSPPEAMGEVFADGLQIVLRGEAASNEPPAQDTAPKLQ